MLVVDEAHDFHHKTLTSLKRLMEVVADAGVLLSVLLVGHPRLTCVQGGLRFAAKPVTAEIVEQVLSRVIDDLDPR